MAKRITRKLKLSWADRLRGTANAVLASVSSYWASAGYFDSRPKSPFPAFNNYPDFTSRVRECLDKFFLESGYGCSPLRSVALFRAARIYDEQFSLEWATKEAPPAESVWLDEFITANKLRTELAASIAMFAEVQGQVLVRLVADEDDRQIKIELEPLFDLDQHIMESDNVRYKISRDRKRVDFQGLISASDTLLKSNFAFGVYSQLTRFDQDDVLETPTITQSLLNHFEFVDEGAWQGQRVNRLYAKPTLVTEFEEEDERDAFGLWLAGKEAADGEQNPDKGWKIGQTLNLARGKAGFIQADNSGITALHSQRKLFWKEISGASGYPLHKAGFPEDVGGGRATATVSEDEALFVFQTRQNEELLFEIFRKAMRIYNEQFDANLKVETLRGVVMSPLSPELAEAKQEILAEDVKEKRITLGTYLRNHPFISDADAEEQAVTEEAAARASTMLAMIGGGNGPAQNDNGVGESNNEI
jgi:hypothetical protein